MSKSRSIVSTRWDDYINEVREFLRMPSVSPTGEGIEETAKFLKDFLFERFRCEVTLLRYGGNPIVYGYMDNGSDKTLILYNMYDVLTVEPFNAWVSPPFGAEIVGNSIINRGALNTKAPLMSMLLGVEVLRDSSRKLPVNLVFILEGEEETGSHSMVKLIEDKRNELKEAQGAYFMMPTEGTKGKPIIMLGKKGVIFAELSFKVSQYDTHGSFVQLHHNPLEIASNLIASLKDKDGNIVADWLYDDVITPGPDDLTYLPELMDAIDLNEVVNSYGIKKTRKTGRNAYIEVYYKPAINIDGVIGGYTGEGTKTITPSEAKLKMDFRLVPNMTPENTLNQFRRHLKERGFKDWVDIKLFHNYDWSKTPPDAHIARAAHQAFIDMGMKSYRMTLAQGSAPEYLFTKRLGIPIITSAPGYGGRIHAPNEFIEVDAIRKMIEYITPLISNWAKMVEK